MKHHDNPSADETLNPAADPAAVGRRARRLKYIERAFTLAAIFVVLILGWSAISGFVALFRKSPDSALASNVAQPGPLPVTPEPLLDFSRGGYWEMAGWRWKIGLANVSGEELESRWAELARRPLPTGLSGDEQQALDRLLEGIRKLPMERQEIDEVTTAWTLDQNALRIRIVSRREGDRESVAGLSAAIRRSAEGNWSLMTLESRPERSPDVQQHILPLPMGTERLCGRTDESGRIVFEIVETTYSLEDLAGYWTETGWDRQPGHLAGAGLASPERNYLFARKGAVVQAWQVPGGGESTHRIAVMRISESSSSPVSGSPDGISLSERVSQ